MSKRDIQHRLLLAMLGAEHEVVRACNRVYKRYGVTFHQFQILRILEGADNPLPQGTIGEALLVSKANLSGLLDRMVSTGLVRRSSREEDRRVVWLELTDRGRTVLRQVEPMRDSVESLLLAGLGPREAETMVEHLETVARRARDIG